MILLQLQSTFPVFFLPCVFAGIVRAVPEDFLLPSLWFLIFFLFRAVLFHHASDFVGGLNQLSKAVDEQGRHIRRYAPGQQYREARRHGRMKAAVVDP